MNTSDDIQTRTNDVTEFRVTTTDHPASVMRDRIEGDGYLFLRGAIPKQQVEEVRHDIIEILRQEGWLLSKEGERSADTTRACVEPQPQFRQVYDRVFKLESFHALPHSDALRPVAEALCGTSVFIHPRKIARLMFPRGASGVDFTTPAHQDYPAIQGSQRTYSVWIPLHDCTLSDGALAVAYGSHLDGVREFTLGLGAGGLEVVDPLLGLWRSSDFQAGDILVFHSLTVHRSLPNIGRNMRLSIDFRFQEMCKPLNEQCLSLAGLPYDWEEVYGNWCHERVKYYWHKHPPLVPFDTQYCDRRDDLALQLGELGDERAISALQRMAYLGANEQIKARARRLLAAFGE